MHGQQGGASGRIAVHLTGGNGPELLLQQRACLSESVATDLSAIPIYTATRLWPDSLPLSLNIPSHCTYHLTASSVHHTLAFSDPSKSPHAVNDAHAPSVSIHHLKASIWVRRLTVSDIGSTSACSQAASMRDRRLSSPRLLHSCSPASVWCSIAESSICKARVALRLENARFN